MIAPPMMTADFETSRHSRVLCWDRACVSDITCGTRTTKRITNNVQVGKRRNPRKANNRSAWNNNIMTSCNDEERRAYHVASCVFDVIFSNVFCSLYLRIFFKCSSEPYNTLAVVDDFQSNGTAVSRRQYGRGRQAGPPEYTIIT